MMKQTNCKLCGEVKPLTPQNICAACATIILNKRKVDSQYTTGDKVNTRVTALDFMMIDSKIFLRSLP